MARETGERKLNRFILTVVISAVLAVSSVIFLILLSFILFLMRYSSIFNDVKGVPFTLFVYMGMGISSTLLIFSVMSLFKNVEKLNVIQNTGDAPITGEDLGKVLDFLDSGEREVVEMLMSAGGSMLQRDIARSGGYSKATVTRILNRLESKGLVERLRHGATNKVVLKRISR
ncbi:MAG: MarR family transcriptional regulator [Thermoplasmatales archaeon]